VVKGRDRGLFVERERERGGRKGVESGGSSCIWWHVRCGCKSGKLNGRKERRKDGRNEKKEGRSEKEGKHGKKEGRKEGADRRNGKRERIKRKTKHLVFLHVDELTEVVVPHILLPQEGIDHSAIVVRVKCPRHSSDEKFKLCEGERKDKDEIIG
jgi:hypothetical protein